MNKDGEWSLSPIYDVVYNTGSVTFGEHFLSINKKNKEIIREDLLYAGQVVALSHKDMNYYIDEVMDAFSDGLKTVHEYGIENHLTKELKKIITI